MYNFNQPPTIKNINEEKGLQEELNRRAYVAAEIEHGVNPSDKTQASVKDLGKQDFNYISSVENMAKSFLENKEWIKKNTEEIGRGKISSTVASAHDEGYKSGRSILESHNKEHYGDDRHAA